MRYRLPLAVILLAGLAFWATRSREAAENAAESAPDTATLLPTIAPDAIGEVAIDSPRKGSVTLTRGEDGSFRITRPINDRADPEAAAALIEALSSLKAAGIGATLAKNHPKLWVDDANGIRVEVRGAAGPLLTFLLGRYMPATEQSMIRLAGEERVIRVEGWLREKVELELPAWRKRTFFDVEPEEVTAVHFQSERGRLSFTRDGEEWKPAPDQPTIEPLDHKALSDRVTALARFRGSDFAPEELDVAAAGTGEDAAVITRFEVAGKHPMTFELRVGAEAGTVKREDGTDKQMHYVQHDDVPVIYTTSKYLHDWMSPRPEDLVKKPEEPASGPQAAAAPTNPAPAAE